MSFITSNGEDGSSNVIFVVDDVDVDVDVWRLLNRQVTLGAVPDEPNIWIRQWKARYDTYDNFQDDDFPSFLLALQPTPDDVSVVTGDAITSQAQTISASGVFTAIGVSGDATTSQAQTIVASGSSSVAEVSGTGALSQAQTIAGTGAATVASVSGVAATSQAETIAGSGSFAGAGVVSGDAATSQAQTVIGDGIVTGALATDTHDGFWRKQWEDVAKQSKAAKKLEKKKKAIEVESFAPIELVDEVLVIETIKPIKLKSNRLIVDRVIESNYDANEDDEDLLMLW